MLSPWELVPAACVLLACGGTALSPWEIVQTAWGEALAAGEPVFSARGYLSVGDSVISLRDSPGCLGTTCLWGDSAVSLGESAGCLVLPS